MCSGIAHVGSAIERWRRQASRYPAHVWIAAEWHGSLPGALKNALDHLGEEDLRGAAVGLIGQAGGVLPPLNTISHLRTIAQHFGTWVLPTSVAVSVDQIGPPLAPSTSVRVQRLAADIARAPSAPACAGASVA
jgi:NAD(P)H-dependent FMN reductase